MGVQGFSVQAYTQSGLHVPVMLQRILWREWNYVVYVAKSMTESTVQVYPLVLASGSTYRAELLRKLGVDFVCESSNIDETPLPGETAGALAVRLSVAKAQAISRLYPEHLVIGSDQVAVCDGQLLSKPGCREAAVRQLQTQSGRLVQFYTGIAVLNTATGQILSDVDSCKVYFRELAPEKIERYVDLEQPFDCAGSFKAENLGIALFIKIETADPNTLIGLPLIKLIDLLARFNVRVI